MLVVFLAHREVGDNVLHRQKKMHQHQVKQLQHMITMRFTRQRVTGGLGLMVTIGLIKKENKITFVTWVKS